MCASLHQGVHLCLGTTWYNTTKHRKSSQNIKKPYLMVRGLEDCAWVVHTQPSKIIQNSPWHRVGSQATPKLRCQRHPILSRSCTGTVKPQLQRGEAQNRGGHRKPQDVTGRRSFPWRYPKSSTFGAFLILKPMVLGIQFREILQIISAKELPFVGNFPLPRLIARPQGNSENKHEMMMT